MPQESLFDNSTDTLIEAMPPKGTAKAPAYFRSDTLRKAPSRVERKNGVIYGYAVCTRGEALGHSFWCDDEFLQQLVKAGNKRKLGIKARFTHPGLSGDGMGRHLGRSKNFRKEGDIVRADLHLAASAYNTPDGDLATYMMDRAEEDPESFGASIVFSHDYGEEDRFVTKYRNEDGDFKSPDPDNKEHLMHARLSDFRACDAVGDPAANPGGFFSVGTTEELAARAEAILEYAFGLSDEAPTTDECGGIHPERLRRFIASFTERHGIGVKPLPHGIGAQQESDSMSKLEEKKDEEEQQEEPEKEEEDQQEEPEKKDEEQEEEPEKKKDEEQSASPLSILRANKTFGNDGDFVLEALDNGWTPEKAEIEYLKRANEAKDGEIAKLKGGAPAAGAGAKAPINAPFDFMAESKALAAEKAKAGQKCSLTQAMKEVARAKPEEYKAWQESQRK